MKHNLLVTEEIIERLKKLGHEFAEDLKPDLDALYEKMYTGYDKSISKFIVEGIKSWNDLAQLVLDDIKKKPYNRMKNKKAYGDIVNKIERMSQTGVDIIVRELNNPQCIMKSFIDTVKIVADEIKYVRDLVDDEAAMHLLEFAGGFGPKSCFSVKLMGESLDKYGRTKKIELNAKELDALVQAFDYVLTNKYDPIPKLTRIPLEAALAKHKSQNPIAAHSYPTHTNIKDEAANEVMLQLARDYEKHPEDYAPIFSLQTRITSAGNTFIEFLREKYSDNVQKILSSIVEETNSLLAEYLSVVKQSGKEFVWFSPVKVDTTGTDAKCVEFSDELRNSFARFPNYAFVSKQNTEQEYYYKYIVIEPFIFNEASDDLQHINGYYIPKCKTRSVFAGAFMKSLVNDSFYYPWVEAIKHHEDVKLRQKFSNWMPPEYLDKRIQNMFSSIDPHISNYVGEFKQDKRIFHYLSADDKSGFDSCICILFTLIFVMGVLGPKFSENSRKILTHSMSDFWVTGIITQRGYEIFSELVPSGHTFTNACDSFACEVTALYSSILTGLGSKDVLEREFSKYSTGDVEAGDDLAQPVSQRSTLQKLSQAYDKLGFIMHPVKGVYSRYMTEFMGFTFLGTHTFINTPNVSQNSLEFAHRRYSPARFMPVGRLMGNIVFAEHRSEYEHTMIGELAIFDRLKNYSYAPYFNDKLYQFGLTHSDFNLCVEPIRYLPAWHKKMAARRLRKNSSADITDLLITVTSQYHMAQIASDEATFYQDSLVRIADKIWTNMSEEDYVNSFNEQFITKLFSNIANKDNVSSSKGKLDKYIMSNSVRYKY